MIMYEKSMIVDMIEAKLLEAYPEYYPQGQYNNFLIQYLYKYIKTNTYTGNHVSLYKDLLDLCKNYKNTFIQEDSDKQTYKITSNSESISNDFIKNLNNILQKYSSNYEYIIKATNRVVVKMHFGYLPKSAKSCLNLLNNETIIDYHIDNGKLIANTEDNNTKNVCFYIKDFNVNSTIMFLTKKSNSIPSEAKMFFATVSVRDNLSLDNVTLQHIVENKDIVDSFYSLGFDNKYNGQKTEKVNLIIQIPYAYITQSYYVYDVSDLVSLTKEYVYVPFDDDSYEYLYLNRDNATKIINSNTDIFSIRLIQFIFGDFIWKTADSKLIAYIQNLVRSLDMSNLDVSNGIWSDDLEKAITDYKENNASLNNNIVFYDGVVNKDIELTMINSFKLKNNNENPNNLFNQW